MVNDHKETVSRDFKHVFFPNQIKRISNMASNSQRHSYRKPVTKYYFVCHPHYYFLHPNHFKNIKKLTRLSLDM